MIKPLVSAVKIKRINGEMIMDADDLLAAEEPLEIRIGFGSAEERAQKNISVTMRTPGHDFELALGFLFTEGIIQNRNEVASVKYCISNIPAGSEGNVVRVELKENVKIEPANLLRNFYTTSSCGVCGKASIDAIRTTVRKKVTEPFFVEKKVIYDLPSTLRAHQDVFEHTGGLHAGALFKSDGTLVLLREDVGRHNALDKLIGASMGLVQEELSLHNRILLLSGRASFELIQKAAMANIKMVCAVGAPSSLAAALAKEMDITLIGFLRENRFNIYSNGHRII
jgi:FdhD protein